MVHEALPRRIIGCAMQVHRTLGNGFQERIYQRALSIEFEHDNLCSTRKKMTIYYRDKMVGTRRVDFFVENLIMVEIKAMNYLECFKTPIGLLLNFGQISLEFKRVHNNKLDHDLKD